MEKTAIKDLIYGGIEEIVRNDRYYYRSSAGENYSHFTEDGKAAISEFMNVMAYKIRSAEEADLDRRAKNMVLKELKL